MRGKEKMKMRGKKVKRLRKKLVAATKEKLDRYPTRQEWRTTKKLNSKGGN